MKEDEIEQEEVSRDNGRIYITLAAAALVVLVAFAVAGRWPGSERTPDIGGGTATTTPETPAGEVAPGSLEVEVVTRASSTPLYAVQAEYPRFPSAPALSARVDDYVDRAVAGFISNVRENDAARRATAEPGDPAPADFVYRLTIGWDPAQLNGRYASFLVRLDAFEGGANLRQDATSFSWDMRADRAVTLAELFPDDSAYLERVSAYARQVLISQLGDSLGGEAASFVNDGTAPTLANFSVFTFNEDAVTFTFPKYQVAPGAAGEQQVAMPRRLEGLF